MILFLFVVSGVNTESRFLNEYLLQYMLLIGRVDHTALVVVSYFFFFFPGSNVRLCERQYKKSSNNSMRFGKTGS